MNLEVLAEVKRLDEFFVRRKSILFNVAKFLVGLLDISNNKLIFLLREESLQSPRYWEIVSNTIV